jgi:hypothetical protein
MKKSPQKKAWGDFLFLQIQDARCPQIEIEYNPLA